MIDQVFWRAFTRDVLPSALFGFSKSKQLTLPNQDFFDPSDIPADHVALGYRDMPTSGYAPPAVIVLEDKSAPELFAWLSVYAPLTAPLSQFARVLNSSDFHLLKTSKPISSRDVCRSDRWASLVLGEILAQGDADIELASVPVSRAGACFSTAMGRASMIYSSGSASNLCRDRLAKLEMDPRFARRPVSVQELNLGWSVLESVQTHRIETTDAAQVVFEGVATYTRELFGPPNFSVDLSYYPGLHSDSVEERVVTFNRIAAEINESGSNEKNRFLHSALLGAAAFLVGRGTSHSFLLRRYSKVFPSSYAWFGVIAAVAGPETWDANWSRIAKSIERGLRGTFEWADPPIVDLCWSEFAWMSNTLNGGSEIFGDMPKIFPRVLSVEIVPGVSCQLRLASSSTNAIEGENRRSLSEREAELAAVMSQFVVLANKARGLLDLNGNQELPIQQSLDLKDAPVYKNARPKKGK